MREKELSICIWIHHIATLIGISEGMYYLLAGKQRFWRSCGVFLLTVLQSRLDDSYRNLEKIKSSRRQRQGILWGMALSSTLFKVLPVRLLGQ